MSKAVLISIRPKWCELIAGGEKTIEVRKTRPNHTTPFKCYIYETKGFERVGNDNLNCTIGGNGRGAVIGEFMCDEISRYALVGIRRERTSYRSLNGLTFTDGINYQAIGLSESELTEYGDGKAIFGWHISGLKIYDQPRKLSEFRKPLYCHRGNDRENCTGCWDCEIKRPPQSWCYAEELT